MDLYDVKDYLRIDHDLDDLSIEQMADAAEAYIRSICAPIEGDLPAPLRQAVLLLTSHWYDSRHVTDRAVHRELPFSISALIANYRDWSAGDADEEADVEE